MPGSAHSAAAERNSQPIATELATLLPPQARVLEIASGTGQHVVHFARTLPGRRWQPSERSAAQVLALDALRTAAALPAIAAPACLDVCTQHWPVDGDFDAVLAINMIHIAPWEATPGLFRGAARHLSPAGAGLVITYGAYREGGTHTAPSNEKFDAWLKAQDPRFGVRDLEAVDAEAFQAGFTRFHLARMPANNLLLAWHRG